MRGKVLYFSQNGLETGITPAGAGKSRTKTEIGGKSEDHPRGCGEKGYGELICQKTEGSPPRVRGKD